MTRAPGISIKSVLHEAPEFKLKEFIGTQTVNVLSALNPELLNRENLVELAFNSAEPLEMLRNTRYRRQLIDLLPLAKARELADNLEIRVKDNSLYNQIFSRASKAEWEPTLRKFFGVVIPERAPGDAEDDVTEIHPNYGLFPHQRMVANEALAKLREPPYKVLVHMPTGAGKTRTAMHIVTEVLQQNPGRLVIWLAQSAELLEQAAAEFEKAWSSLGAFNTRVFRYWGKHEPDVETALEGFFVAGFGKLNALSKKNGNMILRRGDRAVLTVIDEAHQAVAPTYSALASCLYEKKPGNGLLGLSATPGRTWADLEADEAVSRFFDYHKVILRGPGDKNPVHFLIEEGYLAHPTFRTLNVEPGFELNQEDLDAIKKQHEIPESVLERLASSELRSVRIISTIEDLCKRHSRVIVFASTVSHAHLLSSILQLRGTESSAVTAFTDRLSRERILTKYKSSSTNPIVVCNYGVLTTGFDAPKTSAAVIARPTRSLVLFSQMVGRAIRGPRAGGNLEAEIVTVVDPQLPGFGNIAQAFMNWEDIWNEP